MIKLDEDIATLQNVYSASAQQRVQMELETIKQNINNFQSDIRNLKPFTKN